MWVRHFETVDELRLALQQFRRTYNQGWIVERHGYRTPAQGRAAQLDQLPLAALARIGVSIPWTGTDVRLRGVPFNRGPEEAFRAKLESLVSLESLAGLLIGFA